MINTADILETIHMIREENLDIRTVTMGISLYDCVSDDIDRLCANVYDKIMSSAKNLVFCCEEIEKLYFHRNDLYSPNLKTSTDPKNVHLVYFYNKAGQGERIYNPDGVCITLATMPHEKFLFPKGIRRLHQRECARLMGFPDSFWIPKSFTEAHRQLGNSVVIDVIQYIANDIGGALIGEDAEFSLF